MAELDALVARVRADGPVPLPLNGWDQASIWGWDETANSLFAELWRNPDDPAKPPTRRIGPDDFTPAITCLATLAQHIAMAVDCDPWDAASALVNQDEEDWDDEGDDAQPGGGSTDVTITEGYGIRWPPSSAQRR